MHNTVAPHPLTDDAQPVPEQQLPYTSIVTAQCDAVWYGVSLCSVWVWCPVSAPPPAPRQPRPFSEGGEAEESDSVWALLSNN